MNRLKKGIDVLTGVAAGGCWTALQLPQMLSAGRILLLAGICFGAVIGVKGKGYLGVLASAGVCLLGRVLVVSSEIKGVLLLGSLLWGLAAGMANGAEEQAGTAVMMEAALGGIIFTVLSWIIPEVYIGIFCAVIWLCVAFCLKYCYPK